MIAEFLLDKFDDVDLFSIFEDMRFRIILR